MVKVNCHVHTVESDGELSAREILERAEREGIFSVCFTDHFRVPKEIHDYGEKRKHSDEYYEDLERLRAEFDERVEVLIGAEVDWFDGYEDWLVRELGDRNYDFLLGSVHKIRNGDSFCNMYSSEEKGSDGERMFVRDYFVEVHKMVRSGLFDSVAHLDIFRKKLSDFSILEEAWYRDVIVETLDLMKENGVCMEVNGQGWREWGEQFPVKWIIEEAVKRGVCITVGNDFHKLGFGEFSEGLDKIGGILRGIGCEEIFVFRSRERVGMRI